MGLRPKEPPLPDLNDTTSIFMFGTAEDDHPQVIRDALEDSVIFLHFRTIVCPACDNIEPTIYKLEDENFNVSFVHIIYDDTDAYDHPDIKLSGSQQQELLHIYDVQGVGGVPMMTIITINLNDDGDIAPAYFTLYGDKHSKDDFQNIINGATTLYDTFSDEYEP